MNRYLAFIFGGFLFVGTCHAPYAAVAQDNKSLLWRISGKGLQRPSFVFGTMHLLCKEDYQWTEAMERSFHATDEVCFEMDLNDPALPMQVAMGMMSQDGRQLKDYFSSEEYQLVEGFITDSLSMNMAMLQQMKPAALLSLFATKVINCSEPVSYESLILESAKMAGKEISGLETAQEQIALFDRLPGDSVVRQLVSLTQDYQKERKEYHRMLEAYRKQDIVALYEMVKETRKEGPALMDLFLDERNVRWVELMEEKMEQRPVFFAVGAGHLWGEQGVLQLLKTQGYAVVPVK